MSRPTVAIFGAICALACATASIRAETIDWPSYNRTLSGERFVALDAINTKNVDGLGVLCEYDTGQRSGFQSGLVVANGALYGTTADDTFAINPDTCKEIWRSHEVLDAGVLRVNRGIAFLDGRVFRGSPDGRVLAYDAKTGARLWATTIADAARGESVVAAPIAWNGMVFIGNAGGDSKGVKGRMYALDAADGHIVWEFYLVPKEAGDFARGPNAKPSEDNAVQSWRNQAGFPISGGATWASYTLDAEKSLVYVPVGNPAPDFVPGVRGGDNLYTGSVVVLDAKTGAYQRHFQLIKHDFHDWDVAAAPVLFNSKGHKTLLAVTPKDGRLYVYDANSGAQLYRKPMTVTFGEEDHITESGTRFCPGTQGGAEWNGPAYDPSRNLLFTGQVEWCVTVALAADAEKTLADAPLGKPWSGSPDGFGRLDDVKKWAGRMTATDADSGARRWQVKLPAPLLGGVTPTSGGLLLFGDVAGTLYAYDTKSGRKLWSKDLGGAVGGGVISYDNGGGQRIAVAAGMTSPLWPAPATNGKIVVLGLAAAAPAESAPVPPAPAPAKPVEQPPATAPPIPDKSAEPTSPPPQQ